MHELRGYTLKNERAYKQAKYFWFDSGAACFLAGVHSEKELKRDNLKGRYLENYIFQQIMSWISTQTIKPEIFYWKPKAQQVEVDFILRSSSKVLGIEVKSAVSVSFKDTKSLRAFMKKREQTLASPIKAYVCVEDVKFLHNCILPQNQ